MDHLTSRQKKILYILSGSDSSVTGKQLAESLHTSIRTIQYEIANLNHSLKNIIHSTNHGYLLNHDAFHDISFILKDNKEDETLLMILKKLVLEDKEWQIDEFAEYCYVSTSTLMTKLKQIQHTLKEHNLEIIRKHSTLSIRGKEFDKRRFINRLILDEVDPLFMNLENCAAYFGDMDIMRIKSMAERSIHKYNCHIEECYAQNLYLNITIALYRMKHNYHMEHMEHISVDTSTLEYKIASDICAQYAAHYTIHITTEDIVYITLLILGQIKPQLLDNSTIQINTLIDEAFKKEISDILMKTFNYYMLNINYEPFLYNFVLHVDALIKRARNHQNVNNAISENIKSNCPFIYDVAVFLAKEIKEKFKIDISDGEIGFISIHIGFVIENSTKEKNLIQVLLLCNDYHHTADNILMKLNENYADVIEITNIISNFDQLSFESSVDLIISTLPIDIVGKRVVMITPFYTMMDHLAVDDAIHTCLKEQETKKEQQLLLTYFHENLFFKRTDLNKKEDVIRFLGTQIENFGLAKKGFVESVLKREQMSSTCFFETFAIPHAIELDAKKTMFCVLINEKGIVWDQHRIKIVLMIAVQSNDRKSFMKIYNSIIHVLWNKDKVSNLVKSDSFTEFLECLKHDMT